jgi:hypothetical protein
MNWRELMRFQNSKKLGKEPHSERYELAGTERNSEPQKALTKLTERRSARTPVNIVNENLDSPAFGEDAAADRPGPLQENSLFQKIGPGPSSEMPLI